MTWHGPPMGNSEIPESADVVIIGAGLGGLTAAALLAKSGMKVAVLEMDARPGGYLAGFMRKKYIFDTAIHWLNQCGPNGGCRRIFDLLDAQRAPATPPLRRIRRYRGEGFNYILTSQPDDLRDQLIADNPDQAAAITKFFAASRVIGDCFVGMADGYRARETMTLWERIKYAWMMGRISLPFLKYLRYSTEQAFSKLFKAPALARMFCSEERLLSCLTQVGWAYTGDYQIPPTGGSRAFPAFLDESIRAWGGDMIFRARANEIHVENKAVTGVSFALGKSGTDQRTIKCPYVLAACDIDAVYEHMLPDDAVPAKLKARVRDAELYDSCVTIHLAVDRPPEELGFGEELIFVTKDDVSRKGHNASDPHDAAISVLAPSLRDPSLAPEGKGTVCLLVTSNMEYGDRWKTGPNFERGPDYKAFKAEFADVVIDRVAEALSPNLRDHIELIDVATPVTHQRYTGNRDGSIMAAKPTGPNIRNRVAHYRTPVKNLFLAGHWAEVGGGVPIAMRAGANAALFVLQKERREAFRVIADVIDGNRAADEALPECMHPAPAST